MLCYLVAAWMDKSLLSSKAATTVAGTQATGNTGLSQSLPSGKSFVARNSVLVLFSLLFYAWGEPVYVLLMLACVFINYVAGLIIDRQEKHRRMAIILGLVCNILILGTFKYAGFFVGILNSIGIPVADPKISLTIGIASIPSRVYLTSSTCIVVSRRFNADLSICYCTSPCSHSS